MKIRLAFLFVLFAISLQAQRKDTLTILPGSNLLDAGKIGTYSASYDFFTVKDGEEKKVGSLEDNFYLDKSNGLRVCHIKFGENVIIDSGLSKAQGLTPVYHRSHQTKKDMLLAFTKEKVDGVVMKKAEGEVDVVSQATPVAPFDSFYEDIMALTVNVKPGVLFRFPEYIYEKGGLVWSLGEVTSSSAGERVVKFYELNSAKAIVRTTTYFISQSTHAIEQREYLIGSNRILMKKRPS